MRVARPNICTTPMPLVRRPRRRSLPGANPVHVAPIALGLVLAVGFLLPAAARAWTTNLAQLDDGTCGRNLQIGADKTASSSATPTFWLQGDGGLSSYEIFVDGLDIGRFNSDGLANVCITTATPLNDGPHTLTGVELAPHATFVVTPFAFSVDTVPPLPPTPPVVSSYSDSGVLGDGITKYNRPNFTGTADALVSVQLYNNGVTGVGGAKADVTGFWSATTTTLADGFYSISAIALDGAGNKSPPSRAIGLTIDTAPPATPAAPTLDPASDTPPTGDNTTTQARPVVTGTVAA